MSTTAVQTTLDTLLTEDAEKLLAKLGETLGAMAGVDATCKAEAGEKPVGSLFAVTLEGPGLDGSLDLMLDGRLVSACAGKLAMASEEEIAAGRESGEVPEKTRDSIEELARMIGNAVGEIAGGEPLAPRDGVAEAELGSWPGSDGDESVSPLCAVVAAGDDVIGVVALSAGNGASEGAVDEPAAEISGWRIEIHGWPGDPLHLHLSGILERLGASVLPYDRTTRDGQEATAALVVTRSAADLQIRLDKMTAAPSRPEVIVACSDRPTLQLVSIARKHGADDFLVLPGDDETLRAALTRTRKDA